MYRIAVCTEKGVISVKKYLIKKITSFCFKHCVVQFGCKMIISVTTEAIEALGSKAPTASADGSRMIPESPFA
jgi:hypothetical protein